MASSATACRYAPSRMGFPALAPMRGQCPSVPGSGSGVSGAA